LSHDAAAAYRHLRSQGVDTRRLVLYGESLGTAVAVRLAATQPVGGVVLESGFTSARAVARELYGFLPVHWFIRSRFDTAGMLPQVQAPVLVLHSRGDEFFGLHHAQQLVASARGGARLVELRGGHNDAFLISDRTYREALASFLNTVREATASR
jgi:pimeloyl-ACP methyl ester carboxylesterase